jgi:hypothetical protein
VEKSPTVALLRSAFLPGLGQLYNGQKLKALVVVGGEAALIWGVVFYHRMADQSTEDYAKTFYQDYRNRYTWFLILAHLVNMLDAYVDAHLWNFDTGPDLSVNGYGEGYHTALLSLRWRF